MYSFFYIADGFGCDEEKYINKTKCLIEKIYKDKDFEFNYIILSENSDEENLINGMNKSDFILFDYGGFNSAGMNLAHSWARYFKNYINENPSKVYFITTALSPFWKTEIEEEFAEEIKNGLVYIEDLEKVIQTYCV